jgi:hypothetical protein
MSNNLYKILGWIIGLLVLLIGIVTLFSDPIAGVIFILIASLILPGVVSFIKQKWNVSLSHRTRVIAGVILLIIFGIYVSARSKPTISPTSTIIATHPVTTPAPTSSSTVSATQSELSPAQTELNSTIQNNIDQANEAFKELYATAEGRETLKQTFSEDRLQELIKQFNLDPKLLNSTATTSASAPVPVQTPTMTEVSTSTTEDMDTSNQPVEQVVSTPTWHTTLTYSNNTTIQTPPFTMYGSEWRVTYSCTVSPQAQQYGIGGQFYGYIYSTDDGSMTDNFASFVNCPHTDTSYLYSQIPGQYYLNLTQANGSYTVTVEDYY